MNNSPNSPNIHPTQNDGCKSLDKFNIKTYEDNIDISHLELHEYTKYNKQKDKEIKAKEKKEALSLLNELQKDRPDYEPTKKDLKYGLETKFKLLYDKRSNLLYFWDNLTDSCEILALIFKKSLVNPYNISLLLYFNRSFLIITLNAIFFDDSQVNDLHSTNSSQETFTYTLSKSLMRIVLSQISSIILVMMFTIPLKIPDRYFKQFNHYMKKGTTVSIKKGK